MLRLGRPRGSARQRGPEPEVRGTDATGRPAAQGSSRFLEASVTIALGMLVIVFQSDWGAKTLDFTNTGSVRDWVPMFLFSILVGLSMDYHVFVLSRIREQLRAGRTPRVAILEGLAATGSVVSSAALVMVGVFSIFATLSLVEMKQIGLGLAVAIAVDATLVRLVLLPAALAVMGTRAWSRRDGRGIPVRR